MTDFFDVLTTNALSDIVMIAGDSQVFSYYVTNDLGVPLALQYTEPYVVIFRYGEPESEQIILSGSIVISGSMSNEFRVFFSGSGISAGLYQQQVNIVDQHGVHHIPAQGKIIVLASPESG